jgi:hypothetical protein
VTYEAQRAAVAARKARRRGELAADGKCHACLTAATGPRYSRLCDPCGAKQLARNAKYRTKTRRAAVQAGNCIACLSAKSEPGKIHCADCLVARTVRALKAKGCITTAAALKALPKRCEICNAEQSPRHDRRATSLVVDHDHDGHFVRGVLCDNCNRAVGLMGDDSERLIAAARYLDAKKFKAARAA